MSLTSAQAAQLYRNLGRPVPQELEGAEEIKRHKYGARKKEVDGILFDSTSEADAYQVLKVWKSANVIFGLDRQPEYILQDGFRDERGKWHRAVKYIADFRFAYIKDQHKIIVADVKGVQTQAFRIKAKLFRAKFPDIDLQIWDRAKVKEMSRC